MQEVSQSFQTKIMWNPPGKLLTSAERNTLLGPSNDVVYYKKFILCDSNTKWMIHFSTKTPLFKEAKISSSFVSLKECGTPPRFGCIVSLFTHSFAEVTFWAVLDIYPEAINDNYCKMWNVPLDRPPSDRLVLCISYPLVVAHEDTTSWFFNNSV